MRETLRILICPYCGDEKSGHDPADGCCGESSAHFEEIEVYADTKEQVVPEQTDSKDEELGAYPIGYAQAVTKEAGYGN